MDDKYIFFIALNSFADQPRPTSNRDSHLQEKYSAFELRPRTIENPMRRSSYFRHRMGNGFNENAKLDSAIIDQTHVISDDIDDHSVDADSSREDKNDFKKYMYRNRYSQEDTKTFRKPYFKPTKKDIGTALYDRKRNRIFRPIFR